MTCILEGIRKCVNVPGNKLVFKEEKNIKKKIKIYKMLIF